MTSVSVADFTPLADEITTEMALQFERQIARAPNVHLARDAITGRARRNMTIRLYAAAHCDWLCSTIYETLPLEPVQQVFADKVSCQ